MWILPKRPYRKNISLKAGVINLRVDDVLLPDGKKAGREVVEHPGGVTVAALTAENELLFVRQFRYPYGTALLELPAGKLESGEDPLVCGIRELREETGASAGEFIPLGKIYPTPAYCNEVIHMYMAKNLTFGAQKLDEDEFLQVEKVKLDEALRMVLNGEIKDAKTQIAVMKTAILLKGELL